MPVTPEGRSIGHEFIGVVEDTGADVTTVKKGDLVIGPFAWSDGTCEFCREGLQTSCRHGGSGTPAASAAARPRPSASRWPTAPWSPPGRRGLAAAAVAADLSDVYGTGYHAAVRASVSPRTRSR